MVMICKGMLGRQAWVLLASNIQDLSSQSSDEKVTPNSSRQACKRAYGDCLDIFGDCNIRATTSDYCYASRDEAQRACAYID